MHRRRDPDRGPRRPSRGTLEPHRRVQTAGDSAPTAAAGEGELPRDGACPGRRGHPRPPDAGQHRASDASHRHTEPPHDRRGLPGRASRRRSAPARVGRFPGAPRHRPRLAGRPGGLHDDDPQHRFDQALVKFEQALNVRDMRELARRRLPRMIFDLVDGGAEDEVTMRANEAAFSQIEFRPRTLVDVSQRSLATSVVGLPVAAPLVLAPAAGTRVVHPDAERAVARAAGQRQVPYAVTARASFTIEELADASSGPLWFAVEVIPDPDLMKSLLHRAHEADYSALVFMVDAPVAGSLERSLRRATIP